MRKIFATNMIRVNVFICHTNILFQFIQYLFIDYTVCTNWYSRCWGYINLFLHSEAYERESREKEKEEKEEEEE